MLRIDRYAILTLKQVFTSSLGLQTPTQPQFISKLNLFLLPPPEGISLLRWAVQDSQEKLLVTQTLCACKGKQKKHSFLLKPDPHLASYVISLYITLWASIMWQNTWGHDILYWIDSKFMLFTPAPFLRFMTIIFLGFIYLGDYLGHFPVFCFFLSDWATSWNRHVWGVLSDVWERWAVKYILGGKTKKWTVWTDFLLLWLL